jgi:hypothetical protein
MEMVTHDAEIFYLERVSPFRAANDFKELFLHLLGPKLLFLSIYPTGDMVAGAFPQLAWMSHIVQERVK